MRLLMLVGLGAALLAGGACGSADDGGGGDPGSDGGETASAPEWERTDDVAVEGHDAPGDLRADLEYTLTNTGETPLAVVDPAQDSDRSAPLADGVVQVAYLAVEGGGSAGGGPLPPGLGVLLEPGESHSGTAQALTRGGGPLPDEVELCVEVVARFDADDDGDGRVSFPARPVDDAPTVACSDRFAVG